MGQEISISLQAVKSKVYKLIDARVEGAKTQDEVQESMRRWWKSIHPNDRPVARKYLLTVLQKSSATLGAINDGLLGFKEFSTPLEAEPERSQKLRPVTGQTQAIPM
jgi:hypothetical protein